MLSDWADIGLLLRDGVVQGKSIAQTSSMQVCYRILKITEEDKLYDFHPEYAKYSTQAARVMEVVKYYEKAYPIT